MSDKINKDTLSLIISDLKAGKEYFIHPSILGKRNMSTLEKTFREEGKRFKAEPYKNTGFLVLTATKREV